MIVTILYLMFNSLIKNFNSKIDYWITDLKFDFKIHFQFIARKITLSLDFVSNLKIKDLKLLALKLSAKSCQLPY
jgi:hypothetical protein